MNTYEIKFNGQITKLRSECEACAIAEVANQNSVSVNALWAAGAEIRVITLSFTSDFRPIW